MTKTKSLILLGLFCLLGCSQKVEQKQEASKAVNILFLLADDQRGGTLQALGKENVITPNLDKLVREGTYFDNAYVMGSNVGAVCAPSRAMLMTGRTLFNIDPTGGSIDSSYTTLPKALSASGYNNFHIGKWHNGKPAFQRSFANGSKIFFGGMNSQYKVPTYEFRKDGNYSPEMLNKPSGVHSSELYANAAIDFLENYKSEEPFFMYVAFQAPHDPREMPEEYLAMYDTATIELPRNYLPQHPFDNGELDIRDEWLAGFPRIPAEVKANIAAYYAMITHLDAQIGRILEKLEEKGLRENTMIVFSADNGLAVGQHGLMGKQNLYEHSIKVPLLFSGPNVPKGKHRDALTYLSDLYPTFCELTDTPIPQSVLGKSLWNIVKGQEESLRESMFFAYKNFQRAARNKDWKIIKYNVAGNVTTQLFNLKEDPYELNNLANQPEYKDQLTKMEKILQAQMIQGNDQARLNQTDWGVPVLPAWKDRVKPNVLKTLRELALRERGLRGFADKKE